MPHDLEIDGFLASEWLGEKMSNEVKSDRVGREHIGLSVPAEEYKYAEELVRRWRYLGEETRKMDLETLRWLEELYSNDDDIYVTNKAVIAGGNIVVWTSEASDGVELIDTVLLYTKQKELIYAFCCGDSVRAKALFDAICNVK